MNMITTRTFKSGNSEAVRLPKDMAFGLNTEVVIGRTGNVVTIQSLPTPQQNIAEMIANMNEIGPPVDGVQPRETFVAPERHGL